ncbi:hypothetical protein V8E36_000020 [Tilletia maclaganii]
MNFQTPITPASSGSASAAGAGVAGAGAARMQPTYHPPPAPTRRVAAGAHQTATAPVAGLPYDHNSFSSSGNSFSGSSVGGGLGPGVMLVTEEEEQLQRSLDLLRAHRQELLHGSPRPGGVAGHSAPAAAAAAAAPSMLNFRPAAAHPSAGGSRDSLSHSQSASDITQATHLSISGASSSGLDGSLAGFAFFARPTTIPSTNANVGQTAAPAGSAVEYSHSRQAAAAAQAHAQLYPPTQAHAGQSNHRPAGAPMYTGLLGPGAQIYGPRMNLPSTVPTSSTPAMLQQGGAHANTSLNSLSASTESQSTSQPRPVLPPAHASAHGGGGVVGGAGPALGRGVRLHYEATLGGGNSMSHPGADTQQLSMHSHSRFPANSTSAESSMDLGQHKGGFVVGGGGGAGGAGAGAAGTGAGGEPAALLASAYTSPLIAGPPGDENAVPHIRTTSASTEGLDRASGGIPSSSASSASLHTSARALAAAREARLKAHVQLGLAVPVSCAPVLDPVVEPLSTTLHSPSAVVTPTDAFLPMPLPSPAETASLRHRGYLAQRTSQLRDSARSASLILEFIRRLREAEAEEWRCQVEEHSQAWRRDMCLERATRAGTSVLGGDGESAAGMGEADHAAAGVVGGEGADVSIGLLTSALTTGSAVAGGAKGGPSPVKPKRLNELFQALHDTDAPDGRPPVHHTAVAMLQNEARSSHFVLQHLYGALQPHISDWVCAPPAPSSFSSLTASRARSTAAAPPLLKLDTNTSSALAERSGGVNDEDVDDAEEQDPSRRSAIAAKARCPRLSARAGTLSPATTTAQSISELGTGSNTVFPSPATAFFSGRQRGAELGSFAPAWDAGPCGARRRGWAELERCGWGQENEGLGSATGAGSGSGSRGTRWGRR